MPINDHRNKNGTLTLDTNDFATQATNIRLEPSTEQVGDPLEVLSGDVDEPDEETTWSLVIEAVQDFDDPAGFIQFAMDNANQLVSFSWAPTGAVATDSVTYDGMVRVRPVPIGGEVGSRLSTSAEWPVDGTPTPTRTP